MSAIDSAGSVGLGTYRLGKQTYFACRTALELGYRHLDTAALYRNEREVARAIADSGIPRREIFVTSKIPLKAIRTDRIQEAAEQSLQRLGAIDLLLLHAPGPDPRSAWETMLNIKNWQAIGDIGVSNFNVRHLQLLEDSPPHWNQIEISPFLQRKELIRYCDRHKIRIVAYSPLVKGQKFDDPEILAIARALGCTPAQLLLAWSVNCGLIALPRSSKREHLQENWEAREIILPREIMQKLNNFEENYATHPRWVESGEQGGGEF
ncbi:MAG: aldo/keto reductase [Cyanobacteria bacterium SBLK]|nr:aldo/keto reductase [Cyanobacteria bacterium SBLK]